MTSEIVHGNPGSYKSAALVCQYGIPALKSGRVVVTNIRGFSSLEKVEEVYGVELPDTSQLIHVSFDDDGFLKMAQWFHWAPKGACILMDEGQRVYPTRLKTLSDFDNRSDSPLGARTVEEAFDTHRHHNYDIYISTTNIAKVHKEVRQIAEFAYRHKNMKSVFSFLDGYYKRVKHDPENSGKSASHAIGSQVKKIDKRVFDCYESTATGKVKDTETKASLLGQPKLLLLFAILAFCIYRLAGIVFSGESMLPSVANHSPVASGSAGAAAPQKSVAKASRVDPRDGARGSSSAGASVGGLIASITHVSAEIRAQDRDVIWFETQNGVLTDSDLARMGITIVKLTSFYLLEFNGLEYVIPTKLNYARPSVSDDDEAVRNS